MEQQQPQNQEPQNNFQQQSVPPQQTPPSAPALKRRFSTQAIIITVLSILLLTTAGALIYVMMRSDDTLGDAVVTDDSRDEERKEEQKEVASEKTAEPDNKVGPVDETASWDTLTSKAYGLSLKHPNGSDWSAHITDDSSSTGQRATGNIKYIPCGPNCGWALSFRVVTSGSNDDPGGDYAQNTFQDNDYYSLASKKSVDKGDITGTRWEYVPADGKAASIIYYYFTKGDFAYTFEVNMNGSKTDAVDITKTGDLIMETLQFTAS